MAMNSLKDVYLDQLQDLWSCCDQTIPVTKDLMEAATDSDLKDALKASIEGTKQGRDKLAEICKAHNIDPDGEFCKGTEGLVTEARAHGLEEEFGDDDARDAMIISQYQRLAHYALTGYGTLLAFAKRLEMHDDASKLEEMLDNTYGGDRRMTEIATQGGVNQAAAA